MTSRIITSARTSVRGTKFTDWASLVVGIGGFSSVMYQIKQQNEQIKQQNEQTRLNMYIKFMDDLYKEDMYDIIHRTHEATKRWRQDPLLAKIGTREVDITGAMKDPNDERTPDIVRQSKQKLRDRYTDEEWEKFKDEIAATYRGARSYRTVYDKFDTLYKNDIIMNTYHHRHPSRRQVQGVLNNCQFVDSLFMEIVLNGDWEKSGNRTYEGLRDYLERRNESNPRTQRGGEDR